MIDLPEVRGRLERDRPLAPLTWLRVGGPAEVLFQPADTADLANFLATLDPGVAVMPLGVGSNLIVRDGGLPGVAIRLGRGFNGIEIAGGPPGPGGRCRAGRACCQARLGRGRDRGARVPAHYSREPSAALCKMNAGCYGSYTADVVESVTVVERKGTDPRASGRR